MKILASLEEAQILLHGGCVATIGNFDGVHLGHQKLIAETVAQAQARQVPSVIITFNPHPEHFFSPQTSMSLLMTPDAKCETIAALGADYILVLAFTKELADLSPQAFVQTILVNALRVRHLVVGYDYAFGKGRAGNAALLSALGQALNFSVEQLDQVVVADKTVSSTSIRNAVRVGNLVEAQAMLGRPFFIDSTVIHGKNRGSTQLGFPTANLSVPKETILPRTGSYAIKAVLQLPGNKAFLPASPPQDALCGVANVGNNPTFGDVPLSVETHLLDFNDDIYHTRMRLWFLHFLREEKKFSSIPALVDQITSDITTAKNYF